VAPFVSISKNHKSLVDPQIIVVSPLGSLAENFKPLSDPQFVVAPVGLK
jgi:hypothetical protein